MAFNSLPNPIIAKIFSYLVPSEIIASSRVNKRCRSIVDGCSFWRDYGFNKEENWSCYKVIRYLNRQCFQKRQYERSLPKFSGNTFLRVIIPKDVMFWSHMISLNPQLCNYAYQHMDKELLKNRRNAIRMLKGSGHFIHHLPKEYSYDFSVALAVTKVYPQYCESVVSEFVDDLAVMRHFVRHDPNNFRSVSDRLKRNPQFFLQALPQSSESFEELDPIFRRSVPFVVRVVSKAGTVWSRLPRKMRYNEQIIRTAFHSLRMEIKQGGYPFQHIRDYHVSLPEMPLYEGDDGDERYECWYEEASDHYYRVQRDYLDKLEDLVEEIQCIMNNRQRFLW